VLSSEDKKILAKIKVTNQQRQIITEHWERNPATNQLSPLIKQTIVGATWFCLIAYLGGAFFAIPAQIQNIVWFGLFLLSIAMLFVGLIMGLVSFVFFTQRDKLGKDQKHHLLDRAFINQLAHTTGFDYAKRFGLWFCMVCGAAFQAHYISALFFLISLCVLLFSQKATIDRVRQALADITRDEQQAGNFAAAIDITPQNI